MYGGPTYARAFIFTSFSASARYHFCTMNTNELLSFENISNLYGLLERQTSIGNEAEIIHHKQTMEQLTSVTPVILYIYTMGEGMSETCNTE